MYIGENECGLQCFGIERYLVAKVDNDITLKGLKFELC